jgi:hypothetical protein
MLFYSRFETYATHLFVWNVSSCLLYFSFALKFFEYINWKDHVLAWKDDYRFENRGDTWKTDRCLCCNDMIVRETIHCNHRQQRNVYGCTHVSILIESIFSVKQFFVHWYTTKRWQVTRPYLPMMDHRTCPKWNHIKWLSTNMPI